MAVKIFLEDPDATSFMINRDDILTPIQTKRLVDYFRAGIKLDKKNDWWVNLSAYESNRMLADSLVNTEAGKILLAQDCILKRLTASLLHPDSEWGKKYWNMVHKEAEYLYGDIVPPFNLYQKVWILPDKATIFEYKLPWENSQKPNQLEDFLCKNPDKKSEYNLPWENLQKLNQLEELLCKNPGKKEGYAAYIVESRLKVLCEADFLAITTDFSKNENFQGIKSFNDLCTSIFKEIVLPVIVDEVNNGQNFILLRQMYNSLILASYCVDKLKDYPKWKEFIRTGQELKLNPVIESADLENEDMEEEFSNIEARLVPSFDPTKENINNYFYNQYIDLFKKGLYTCTRKHFNPKSQKVFTRTYFSGGIRLWESYVNFQRDNQFLQPNISP